MKETTYRCDRCGVTNDGSLEWARLQYVEHVVPEAIDLCVVCSERFRQWLTTYDRAVPDRTIESSPTATRLAKIVPACRARKFSEREGLLMCAMDVGHPGDHAWAPAPPSAQNDLSDVFHAPPDENPIVRDACKAPRFSGSGKLLTCLMDAGHPGEHTWEQACPRSLITTDAPVQCIKGVGHAGSHEFRVICRCMARENNYGEPARACVQPLYHLGPHVWHKEDPDGT